MRQFTHIKHWLKQEDLYNYRVFYDWILDLFVTGYIKHLSIINVANDKAIASLHTLKLTH
jgi:hypothetical protein